jgi:hypothetical protein
MRRKFAILGAGAVVLLSLAGCGGGSSEGSHSSSSSSSASSSESSFARAADAACSKADGEVAALKSPAGTPDLVRYLGRTEAIVVHLRRRIEDLKPADKASRAYVAALQRSSVVLNEMFDAAQSENPDAVGELSKTLAGLRLGRLAKQAGLTVCARPLEAGA